MNIYNKIINFKTNLLLFSGKWGPNERGPTPFVKLCRFGGSGFGIGKERFVTISTKGACKGDWLGELDVVSDGEVVFEDVVVVEEEDDEVFSLVTFVLSIACFASSVTLILLLAEWQDDSSTGSKGAASSGVGGAIRLWVGCELKKNWIKIFCYKIQILKILTWLKVSLMHELFDSSQQKIKEIFQLY